MPKTERFTFLTDREGRNEIKALAERLQRSESDAVRVAVREKVRELAANAKAEPEKVEAVNDAR